MYAIMKSPTGSSPDSHFVMIGRVAGNDLVMPDFSVSARHARIEIGEGLYRIVDLGSTNGTTLNNVPVGSTPVFLNDMDIVAFARYEFTVVFPVALYGILRS